MMHTSVVMPDFLSPTAGFAHSVDSALLALEHLGVLDARITLLMDGPGRPDLAVVKQSPPPGTPLLSGTRITLSIAGFGFFYALPLPMRESGAEREMGTREICRVFDSPIEKMARWLRAGAPMFAFSEQRPETCRRWLALFGIDGSRWPEELLFRLSLLMPAPARLAGRQSGIKLTMRLLFDLSLHSVESFATYRSHGQVSRLGERSSRLGVDWIAGDGMRDVDGIRLRLGPVPLTRYKYFQSDSGREALRMACDLCLSAYQDYTIAWLVEDRSDLPMLGNEMKNGRLGVNFHLGEGSHMNPQDTYKPAVNWEFGMLVTPEHFLRQQRFHEASLLWMLRYTSRDFGLVGGGMRLPEALSGIGRHDPIIQIAEDEESVQVTVTQCRGLTPAGTPVEITPETSVTRRFAKSELADKRQLRIHLLVPPHEYVAVDGPVDEHNPQMQTEQVRACRITLEPHGESLDHALTVGALRVREQGPGYEIDPRFFPPCLHMGALSELTASWRRMVDLLAALSRRFLQLHRAMQDYIEMARERGIDGRLDDETLVFVRSILPILDGCLEECLDISQSPERFLAHLRKLTHGAALHLNLSPPVRQYFDALRSAGEAEFAPALDHLTNVLQSERRWRQSDDLAKELQSAERALRGIEVLERALEGKYIDFRVSPLLESMNFFFDRGGSALYKLAAKPARLQGFGDQMTFYFANIRLEGREKYRMILTAHAARGFDVQEQIPVELGMNEGSGARRTPLHGVAYVRAEGQNNVEFDFDAPEVQTIIDLRVTVPARFPVSGVLLFVRHRFYVDEVPVARSEVPREEPVTAFRQPLQPGGLAVNDRLSRTAREDEQYVEAPVAPPCRRRLE